MKRSQEALALARELSHPFSLADVLCYSGCLFNEMRRDAQALKDHAEGLVRLGNENVPGWLGQGTWHRGEALAMLGQVHEGIAQMREGLAIQQKAGAERCYWSGCLCSLAEGYAKAGQPREGLTTLDKAQTLVEQTGERYAEAELYRLRAEILLMQGDDAGAEASLHKALEVARRQNAKLWELRAATSLARLWSKHGRRNEARQMLAEKYGWFSEGFDTPDLREAEALLEELS